MINWLPPSLCVPPHRVTHPLKLAELTEAFRSLGWNPDEPALIGYPWGSRIQLVSGTHRHAAAMRAMIDIPVDLRSYGYMRSLWGRAEWVDYLANPPRAGR